MTPPDNKDLERFVHRALRELPARRAPSTLEARVQAEIARRAALPWWRKSFAHWPLAARGAFVVVSAGVAKVILMALVWATAGFNAADFRNAFATEIGWFQTAARMAGAASDLVHTLVGLVPPIWLYGGAALIVALYVALFGLGAAAYRTLYANS